jgi:hypothetical protein
MRMMVFLQKWNELTQTKMSKIGPKSLIRGVVVGHWRHGNMQIGLMAHIMSGWKKMNEEMTNICKNAQFHNVKLGNPGGQFLSSASQFWLIF